MLLLGIVIEGELIAIGSLGSTASWNGLALESEEGNDVVSTPSVAVR